MFGLSLDDLSRLKSNPSAVIFKSLNSSALGNNDMYILNMDGRVTIDLYKLMQREKLDSYKLDFVANKYLKQNKDDVSPNEIFKFQKGSNSDRAIIAKYCIQYCLLVNKLIDKLCRTTARNYIDLGIIIEPFYKNTVMMPSQFDVSNFFISKILNG